jgi:hypothetical protein
MLAKCGSILSALKILGSKKYIVGSNFLLIIRTEGGNGYEL